MGALWIRALGPLEVLCGGRIVTPTSGKLRVVLECLALRVNSVVAPGFLAEVVWGEHPPARPGSQLQVYISNLRGLLEPDRTKGVASRLLASVPGGYQFSANEDELDLLQFRELIADGEQLVQSGNLAGGAERLRQGLDLFRGPVFPDLAETELLAPDLDEVEEARLNAHQDLAEVELALGRSEELVGELQRLVSLHPYRERLWASLVLALYRSGRQADALAACRHARKTFTTDLGIDPGPRLRELQRQVLRQDPALAAPAVTSRPAKPRLDTLPAELTPLVGRDAELDEICHLYGSNGCRLISVTGPGGSGKTRLALAAATRLGPRMADGVSWVNLAPLTQVRQVPTAISMACGLEDHVGEEPLKAVSRFLRRRRMLLVLDNFEHLEDAWPVVLDLLTAAPNLHILTTSRRRLGLRPEYELELPPLGLPPLDPPLRPGLLREVPAVKLFTDRARTVRPHFDVDDGNAAVLTRLCHRLDGLPLPIELAAAQLRHLSERDLLADLEKTLGSLPAAFRDVPDRQRTMTATMEWSYRLLPDAERLVFDQLGVFASDPTVAAIAAVHGRTPPGEPSIDSLVSSLAGHSLLRRYSDSAGCERISMLQAVREFARDRLALLSEQQDVRRRHATHYLAVAESVGPQLWGRNQVQAFQRLHADALDLHAALLWAAGPAGSTELALRLVGHLWHYWEITGDVADQQRIAVELVEGAVDVPSALRAPALSGAATLSWTMGLYNQAAHLHGLALQAFRETHNGSAVAWTTMCLAVQAAYSGDRNTAERLSAEALACPDASLRTRLSALVLLSRIAFYTGQHDRALELSQRCLELGRPLGDRSLLGVVLLNLAECTEQVGDYDSAERLLHEALAASLELGAYANLAAILESLAGVQAAQGHLDPAIRLLSAASTHRSDHGPPLDSEESRRVEALTARLRTAAGPIRFALAWTGGSALTLTQACSEALAGSSPQGVTVVAGQESSGRDQLATEDVDPAPWS